MQRKKPPTLDDQLDSLLGAALAAGWDDPVGDAAQQVVVVDAPEKSLITIPTEPPLTQKTWEEKKDREYPPLPQREYPVPDVRSTAGKRATAAGNEVRAHVSELMGLPANLTADQDTTIDEGELPANKRLLNIGMLSDIATGRQTPAQAAETAGVTMEELQAGLAVELGQMDPKDIAKAMGVQAAQEQLKAGALFGAVINDLVKDMVEGRLTPALKLQLAEMLSVVGRVKPKEDKGAGVGGGFVLNISMGAAPAQPVTIEG